MKILIIFDYENIWSWPEENIITLNLPITSIINEHFARLPAESWAWHITSVSPISNRVPFAALHETIGVSFELSVDTVAFQNITAVGLLKLVPTVWLEGQINVGASVSALKRVQLRKGRWLKHTIHFFRNNKISISLYWKNWV